MIRVVVVGFEAHVVRQCPPDGLGATDAVAEPGARQVELRRRAVPQLRGRVAADQPGQICPPPVPRGAPAARP